MMLTILTSVRSGVVVGRLFLAAIIGVGLTACTNTPGDDQPPLTEPAGYDRGSPRHSPEDATEQVDAAAAEPTTPAFTDLQGRTHYPLQATGSQKLTTLIFITYDCPVSNGSAPAIKRLAESFTDQGVQFYLVHTDKQVTAEQAASHAQEYGYEDIPVLIDREYQLVDAVDATVTPQAFVLDAGGEVLYRGRINNEWEDFGVRRIEPTEHDLRNALQAAVAGEPVSVAETDAIGCFIP